MKELHMICNAHLDPVWQWDWEEGIAQAIGTFYSAAELADEYDYVFCHNEAILYEYIEAHDPELFKRIQELVKAGKWHIMGGWYCQPDCNVPSGESFVRQIESGKRYFKEKFNVEPTVAINFDSFGHTQGLVQIMKKCGYEGYMFCRPMRRDKELNLPHMYFNWKGFDGSSIKALRCEDDTIYCSMLGKAVSDIKRKMQPWKDEETAIVLWGVGNHGGGASRKDLSDIENFKIEESGNIKIIHSTPEAAIKTIQPKVDFDAALQPLLVKAYTSLGKLKQKFVELENKLYNTEKICALADIKSVYDYNQSVFEEAQRCLAGVQFHDVLSGTCIEIGEKSSIRRMEHALEILNNEFNKAFFGLTKKYTRGGEGEFPVFVFNPNPYKIDGCVEFELFMLDSYWEKEEGHKMTIKKDGVEQKFQIIKEDSNINMDRSKRMIVRTEIEPFGLTRFDVKNSYGTRVRFDRTPRFELNNGSYDVKFSHENGGLNSIQYSGKEYLRDSIMPIVFDDNANPWGHGQIRVGENFTALKPVVVNRTIERGDVITTTESIYTTGKSDVRIAYRVYKDLPYIDVNVNVSWNDEGKGLKLEVPFKTCSEFIGQTAFGTQTYEKNIEQCAHRFCAVKGEEKYLAIFNNGTFGCAVENEKLYLTLFNGSAYCAHIVEDLPLLDEQRFNHFIEIGRHEFAFRINLCERDELDVSACEFNNKLYALNVYPHGKGDEDRRQIIELSDNSISLVSFRKLDGVYMVRLMNNSPETKKCSFRLIDETMNLSFGKYEAKTLVYRNGKLTEQENMLL